MQKLAFHCRKSCGNFSKAKYIDKQYSLVSIFQSLLFKKLLNNKISFYSALIVRKKKLFTTA